MDYNFDSIYKAGIFVSILAVIFNYFVCVGFIALLQLLFNTNLNSWTIGAFVCLTLTGFKFAKYKSIFMAAKIMEEQDREG